jgi:hypothetical protein
MVEIKMRDHNSRKIGHFRYLDAGAESSLYRNGKCLTTRDIDGNDSAKRGMDFTAQEMPITDARTCHPGHVPSLHQHGFELRSAALPNGGVDFFDHTMVLQRYYPDCAEIVRQATGARIVKAFDHNIRSAAGKSSQRRIEGGQNVQGPAHVVHGDYTLTSAPERLRQLAEVPKLNDTVREILPVGDSLLAKDHVDNALCDGRFSIINLWRNIAATPVQVNPLALCSAASVKPEDLVVFEIHYADRIGENYFAKHAASHEWFYYPEMTTDEVLLIKQWDSAGSLAMSAGRQADDSAAETPSTFSFHSAFKDAATPPDAPDRWSMEVRCAVIY